MLLKIVLNFSIISAVSFYNCSRWLWLRMFRPRARARLLMIVRQLTGLYFHASAYNFSRLSRLEWTIRCSQLLLSMRPTSLCHQWLTNERELMNPSQGVFTNHSTVRKFLGDIVLRLLLKSVNRYLNDFDFVKKSVPLSVPLNDNLMEFQLGNW